MLRLINQTTHKININLNSKKKIKLSSLCNFVVIPFKEPAVRRLFHIGMFF